MLDIHDICYNTYIYIFYNICILCSDFHIINVLCANWSFGPWRGQFNQTLLYYVIAYLGCETYSCLVSFVGNIQKEKKIKLLFL